MDYSRDLLFFFSALGAFNGFLLGLYFLFFIKSEHISNRFLGALLIALSTRIGKSVFFYFNPDLAFHYLQLGLTACFFIGPSLYFYIKSIVESDSKTLVHWKYHYAILAAIALVVGGLYPFEQHVELWRPYIIKAIYWEWLAYILATAWLLRNVIQRFIQQKDARYSVEVWLISIWLGNVIIWTSYYYYYYTSYIAGALSFSFILYLLILLLIFNKKQDFIIFKKQPKYRAKKIEQEEAEVLVQKLKGLMEEQHLYKNPKLKMPELAQHLGILPHRLSHLVNDKLDKSFSAFINEYRIAAAQEMIKTNELFSLEAIGYECGFNSKSTFFTTFKKMTGTTPAKFKKTLLI